jgi:hypothetical protein
MKYEPVTEDSGPGVPGGAYWYSEGVAIAPGSGWGWGEVRALETDA